MLIDAADDVADDYCDDYDYYDDDADYDGDDADADAADDDDADSFFTRATRQAGPLCLTLGRRSASCDHSLSPLRGSPESLWSSLRTRP